MKITVIGWYGTETIGDRGILAGLVSLFYQSFGSFDMYLGSLNPFFSERTIAEDSSFFKDITGHDIDIQLFNSKSAKQLLSAIKNSDLLVMGGGPLMDLSELFMVEYAFKKAKKEGVKTAVLGCGVGPLFSKKYRKSVMNIFLTSDVSILRDSNSKHFLKGIFNEFNNKMNLEPIKVSFDPAVECTLRSNIIEKNIISVNMPFELPYIAINLREFPLEYSAQRNGENINNDLTRFVGDLADSFPNKIIKLIPMHYFHIGGDDRLFLNDIARELNRSNIEVQNTPLTLKETIHLYRNAEFNVGMRFHSVVLQTIASGKNYVLDYTEPKKGKINGFLMDVDKTGFYKKRYICLQEDDISASLIKPDEIIKKFLFDQDAVQLNLNTYVKQLQKLMK